MSAIRNTLITNLTTTLTGSNASVSSELPFIQSGDVRLDIKNKKTLYIDQENVTKEVLYNTLGAQTLANVSQPTAIYETITTVTGYLTVDAKNQPGDIDTITNAIIESRLGITGPYSRECVSTTEITLDYITYEFDFEFKTI
tara:strand:- start:316 stop:741 length:426 start_codon:yes stop_codon:yes gene_type:complete